MGLFTGGSAGGLGINYLTWVYHRWNADRYTPRGIVYTGAQLTYFPPEDFALNLYVENLDPDVHLPDVLSASDCSNVIGNSFCGQTVDYNLCNATWNELTVAAFCGDAFASTSIGEVLEGLTWPQDDALQSGFGKLWHTEINMQMHKPADPFYL